MPTTIPAAEQAALRALLLEGGEAAARYRRVFLASGREAADRESRADALAHQALHDHLTGLPNRALFYDRIEQGLHRLGWQEAVGASGTIRAIGAAIKAGGAVAGIQIAHAGRKASTHRPWDDARGSVAPAEGGWTTVAPSAIAFDGYAPPVAMTDGDIDALVDAGRIDVYGVGTSLVTGSGAPTAGMVYKLVEVDGRPVAKRSRFSSR